MHYHWSIMVQYFEYLKNRLGQKFNNKFYEELIIYFLYNTDSIEEDASNNSSIVSCVFFARVMFLYSRCLATMGVHIQTNWWEGLCKYAAETDSGTIIYIPSFHKDYSGIQKLIGLDSQSRK